MAGLLRQTIRRAPSARSAASDRRSPRTRLTPDAAVPVVVDDPPVPSTRLRLQPDLAPRRPEADVDGEPTRAPSIRGSSSAQRRRISSVLPGVGLEVPVAGVRGAAENQPGAVRDDAGRRGAGPAGACTGTP